MMNSEKWKNLWDAFRENNKDTGRDLNPFGVGTGYEDLQSQAIEQGAPAQQPMPPPQTMPLAAPMVQSAPQPVPGMQQAMPGASIGTADDMKARLGTLEREPDAMPADVAMMFLPPWVKAAMGGFKAQDAPNALPFSPSGYKNGGGF